MDTKTHTWRHIVTQNPRDLCPQSSNALTSDPRPLLRSAWKCFHPPATDTWKHLTPVIVRQHFVIPYIHTLLVYWPRRRHGSVDVVHLSTTLVLVSVDLWPVGVFVSVFKPSFNNCCKDKENAYLSVPLVLFLSSTLECFKPHITYDGPQSVFADSHRDLSASFSVDKLMRPLSAHTESTRNRHSAHDALKRVSEGRGLPSRFTAAVRWQTGSCKGQRGEGNEKKVEGRDKAKPGER